MDPWRVVERFEVTGATEHGRPLMLIYNQHRPCDRRAEQRFSFRKAVLHDALRFMLDNEERIGFGYGGDRTATCHTGRQRFIACHSMSAQCLLNSF